MFSDAMQDEFAIRVNSWKKEGFYIDIGSCGAFSSNNTAMLDKWGWRGICVEKESSYISSYRERTCQFINEDALKIDYFSLFEKVSAPQIIDYASIDIDQLSIDVLKILPHENYRFRCITIEHDAYLYSDTYREQQRNFLRNKGYYLLCSNVFVEQQGFEGKKCPFEDWWVDPQNVDVKNLSNIQCDSDFPSNIISRFQ